MNRLECVRVATLLQGRAAGLSASNALRLEEHLAQCPECTQQAQLLDGLRELSDAGAAPLSHGARQRAVLQAFAAAQRPSQPTAAASSWFVPSALGALCAAAIVGLAILRHPQLGSGGSYRLISGQLEHTSARAGAHVETRIASRAGGVVALAHATVEFRAQTRGRWDGQRRVLRLDEGSVVADVDPSQHESFRVDTERFRVLVLGTYFEVSRADVRVTRGRVRVEAVDGRELAVLGPGESFSCPVAPCSVQAPRGSDAASAAAGAAQDRTAAARTAPSADAASPQGVASPVPSGEAPVQSGKRAAAGRPAPNAQLPAAVGSAPSAAIERQLDQARAALGQRDFSHARDLVANVLALDLQPRERAEALSLRAECALVAGDLAGAAASYRLVAQRFASLPAGENALFASARIDADRLSGERARAGLTQYLARYPKGRFVKEATARLRELRETHSQP